MAIQADHVNQMKKEEQNKWIIEFCSKHYSSESCQLLKLSVASRYLFVV